MGQGAAARLLIAEGVGAGRGAGAESSPPALWMRKALRGGGKGVAKGLRCQGLLGGQHSARERAGPGG